MAPELTWNCARIDIKSFFYVEVTFLKYFSGKFRRENPNKIPSNPQNFACSYTYESSYSTLMWRLAGVADKLCSISDLTAGTSSLAPSEAFQPYPVFSKTERFIRENEIQLWPYWSCIASFVPYEVDCQSETLRTGFSKLRSFAGNFACWWRRGNVLGSYKHSKWNSCRAWDIWFVFATAVCTKFMH